MAIKTSSAKAKGRNLQKWVCKKLADVFKLSHGYADTADIKPRPMGQSGVDIIFNSDQAQDLYPYSIECKSTEHFNLNETLKQAKKNCVSGTEWLIVLKKKSFKNPIVIMDFDVFVSLNISRLFRMGAIDD
ncbi:MAG: hypothetical protein PVI88_00435 [Nitrosopumilaceae archaeon]|jgi:hypothetical protein